MSDLRQVHIDSNTWKYKVFPWGLQIYSPFVSKGTQPIRLEHVFRSSGGAVTPADVKFTIEALILKTKPMPNLVDQHNTGVYGKFFVERRDGRDRKYGDRTNADYFVLDLTYDKFAKAALEAYIKACEIEYPQLANDLRKKLKK